VAAPPAVWVLFPLTRKWAPFARSPAGRAPHLTLDVVGMGPAAARRWAGRLTSLPAERRPALIVLAGVAGALAPSLAVGDLVAADAVLSGGQVLSAPPLPPGVAALPADVRRGPLLSADRVLITPEEKAAAHAEQGALAVEMEAAEIARAATAAGLPWAVLRAVSDTAAERLPLDFNRLRAPDGNLPIGRVAGAALAAPAAIPGLLRLGRNTDRAVARLTAALAAWLAPDYHP